MENRSVTLSTVAASSRARMKVALDYITYFSWHKDATDDVPWENEWEARPENQEQLSTTMVEKKSIAIE
jgi:hypothetical protein